MNSQGVKVRNRDILIDYNGRRDRPWRQRKAQGMQVAYCFKRDYPKMAQSIFSCGTDLVFLQNTDGEKHLHSAFFCRQRMCPMCQWRRSNLIGTQFMQLLDYAGASDADAPPAIPASARFIFLTLTLRSVAADDLSFAIDSLLLGFKYLMKDRQIKKLNLIGWYRGLEITHDHEELITSNYYYGRKAFYDKRDLYIGDRNPNFDTYHPHLHVLLCVPDTYFSEDYKHHSWWAGIWQRCAKLDYFPVIDIRICRSDSPDGRDIRELVKYPVKSASLLIYKNRSIDNPDPDTGEIGYSLDLPFSRDVLGVFYRSMHGRRLVSWGGLFKKIRAYLKLADVEAADLIHVDDDNINGIDGAFLRHYFWGFGAQGYNYYAWPEYDTFIE